MIKNTLKLIAGIGLFVMPTSPPARASDMAMPDFLSNDASVKAWVEKVFYDDPPQGGDVHCLGASKPELSEGVWVVLTVVKITVDKDTKYIWGGVGYDPQTKKSEIGAAYIIPEGSLQHFLDGLGIKGNETIIQKDGDVVTVIEI